MSWLYRYLVRPALFAQDAEAIHNRTMKGLALAGRHKWLRAALCSAFAAPKLPINVMGLEFPNPVGLAAGMDKSAEALPAWAALGFGFTELGAVTWHAQPGNPSPRVFRAIPERAIVNRMGFNNPGAEAVAQGLAAWRESGLWPAHPVGMNLGKSKITPLENAAEDYAKSLGVLLPHLDFFVINVSSPNTPNLRQLQDKAALQHILAAVQEARSKAPARTLAGQLGRGSMASVNPSSNPRRKPILVKVAPDLSFEALDEILELAQSCDLDGIVATNTTISRPETLRPETRRVYAETGGLSGSPLKTRSTEIIRHIYKVTAGKLPIIGVGGIFESADAWEKIQAGASLVQVYTGMVYEGPGIARAITSGLLRRVKDCGLGELSELVGTEGRPGPGHFSTRD